jgi:DNA-binding FrmR family transcriptional regulator
MAHIQTSKKKIISRIRRLQGQLEALVRAVEGDEDCFQTLQTAAASRGAFMALFLELLVDHVKSHITDAKDLKSARRKSADLSRIFRGYLK